MISSPLVEVKKQVCEIEAPCHHDHPKTHVAPDLPALGCSLQPMAMVMPQLKMPQRGLQVAAHGCVSNGKWGAFLDSVRRWGEVV
jgi:hypothetical protein